MPKSNKMQTWNTRKSITRKDEERAMTLPSHQEQRTYKAKYMNFA